MTDNYLKNELYELIKTDDSIFDFIQESSLDGLWYWDLENPENEWMSSRFWTILGYNPEEMPHLSSAWQSIINSDDLKIAIENFTKHLENPKHPYDQIVRYTHKNGSTIWIRCRGLAIRDKHGKPIRMLGAHHDITSQKEAELTLKRSKALLSDAEISIGLGCWEWDIAEDIAYWSEGMFSIFKRKPADGAPNWQQHSSFYVKEDFEKYKKVVADCLNHGTSYQFELRAICTDGEIKHCLARGHAERNQRNEVFRLWGTLQDITEQKLVENELVAAKKKAEENEINFKSYFDSNPTTIFIWSFSDDDFVLIDVNETANRITEGKAKDFIGLSSKLIYADLPLIREKLFECFSTKSNIEFEHNYLTRYSSKYEWIKFKLAFLEPNKVILYTETITKQKNTEQELITAKEKAEESEEKFRLLHENAGIGIGYYSPEGVVLSFNQLAAKHMNGIPEDFIGKSIYELFPKESADYYFGRIKKAAIAAEPKVYEDFVELPTQDLWFISTYTKIVNSQQKVLGIQIISQDISKLKLSEMELQKAKDQAEESEAKYRAMYVNAPLSYQSLDENGCFIDINPMWLKTLGYNRDEVIGKWYGDFLHPDFVEHFRVNFPAFKKRGYVSDVQFKLRKKDNTFIYVSFEGCIGYTPDGQFKQTYCVFKDITEQKAIEEEIIKAKEKAEESDRLKSAFLANMSHEIRTPMNGILGFAELLKEPELSGEQQKEYINIIEKSGKRMLNIINDIIDISKIESGLIKVLMKESNINEQLHYIYSFFKQEVEKKALSIEVTKYLPSNEAVVSTDREKLFAILTNLVKNAVKFTDHGKIEFGCYRKENEIEFFVSDTGIGINRDRQQAIFERFIQADIKDNRAFQGAGLGLSISKAYVEMLGGKIWVESEVSKGSIFYFTIPYISTNNETSIHENTIQNKNQNLKIKKLKVLIVEDDESSKLLIVKLIEKYSSEILFASNGLDAVDLCRSTPDIDLIFMDIHLPKMNGYIATKQIREFRNDIVIIAQTAFGMISDNEKAIEAGCNDFISKPLKSDSLFGLIQKYFSIKYDCQ